MREKKSVFERALTELQMKLYVTYCGEAQKMSKAGEPYGWPGAVFCTAESFFPGVEDEAEWLDPEEAVERIAERIREIHPDAEEREIRTLINPAR